MMKIIYIIENDWAIRLLSYSTTFQLLLLGSSRFPKTLIVSTFKLMHIHKMESEEQRTAHSMFALVASAKLNHFNTWKLLCLNFLNCENTDSKAEIKNKP